MLQILTIILWQLFNKLSWPKELYEASRIFKLLSDHCISARKAILMILWEDYLSKYLELYDNF